MSASRIQNRVIIAVLMEFFQCANAHANLDTFGYRIEGNGVKVEVQFGEVDSDADLEPTLTALNEIIREEHVQNPNAYFEAAWIDSPDDDSRGPAQLTSIVSRAKKFTQQLISTVSSRGVEIDRSGGIKLEKNFYLDHSNLTWTTIRTITSTGLRVGTLMYSGLSLLQAVELSSSVAFACTLTAALYIPINRFAEKSKIYRVLSPEHFPKINALLTRPSVAPKIEWTLRKSKWGLIDLLFGATVMMGENMARASIGLPFEFPTLLQYVSSSLLAISSQQVWDHAVVRYGNALDLENNVNDPAYQRIKKANVRKRGAIGSILSVLGFTASNSHYLPLKIAGFFTLGTLGVTGYLYQRKIENRIANTIRGVSDCNLLLTEKADAF